MKVFIGADHRGFQLKEMLEVWLTNDGHEVIDCGNFSYDKDDDYPDYAFKVAENVSENKESKGILICGSGIGVAIAANKIIGIRAALCVSVQAVTAGRKDDNINVLCLPSDTLAEEQVKEFIRVFLATDFSGEEKHIRRLKKIEERESAIKH